MNSIRHPRLVLVAVALLVAVTARARAQAAPSPASPATPTGGADVARPMALAIGQPAPMRETRMKAVDGRERSIAAVAGKKGTLVIFMCKHCPWVKQWQRRIARIGNAAQAQGVGVIAVNANDPAAYPEDDFEPMKAQAKQLGFKFPYVVDATSEVARAFGATRTPEVFLFDAEGRLVYHGAVDDNARDEKAVQNPWLKQAIDAVVVGKAVSTAETKMFGCGIKFRGAS
ncbi:MAG: thioredoxin family protein [Candidatus Eisenbacteria bacterium]|uniref:Thioredoxin family protein n=1 Tax=Eiseniibacteriota bacterium TaxID=2212470 RepID=A0A538TVG0_UNCEI|nr:MAG: thioredoxin family protein [Candidatus Eisenbacteria bacterium]